MLLSPFKKFLAAYLKRMKRWERHHPLLNTLIVLLGIVLLWRGVWGLLDLYFFPDNPALSTGIGLLLGFIILLLDDFELDEI